VRARRDIVARVVDEGHESQGEPSGTRRILRGTSSSTCRQPARTGRTRRRPSASWSTERRRTLARRRHRDASKGARSGTPSQPLPTRSSTLVEVTGRLEVGRARLRRARDPLSRTTCTHPKRQLGEDRGIGRREPVPTRATSPVRTPERAAISADHVRLRDSSGHTEQQRGVRVRQTRAPALGDTKQVARHAPHASSHPLVADPRARTDGRPSRSPQTESARRRAIDAGDRRGRPPEPASASAPRRSAASSEPWLRRRTW